MVAGKPAHRPSKLTPERQETICEELRSSANLTRAAAKAGIAKRTLTEWRTKGAEESEGIYADLLDATDKAIAEWEQVRVERIESAGKDPKSWNANAWLLERNPLTRERWATRTHQHVELTGKDGDPVEINTKPGAQDAARRFLRDAGGS